MASHVETRGKSPRFDFEKAWKGNLFLPRCKFCSDGRIIFIKNMTTNEKLLRLCCDTVYNGVLHDRPVKAERGHSLWSRYTDPENKEAMPAGKSRVFRCPCMEDHELITKPLWVTKLMGGEFVAIDWHIVSLMRQLFFDLSWQYRGAEREVMLLTEGVYCAAVMPLHIHPLNIKELKTLM